MQTHVTSTHRQIRMHADEDMRAYTRVHAHTQHTHEGAQTPVFTCTHTHTHTLSLSGQTDRLNKRSHTEAHAHIKPVPCLCIDLPAVLALQANPVVVCSRSNLARFLATQWKAAIQTTRAATPCVHAVSMFSLTARPNRPLSTTRYIHSARSYGRCLVTRCPSE